VVFVDIILLNSHTRKNPVPVSWNQHLACQISFGLFVYTSNSYINWCEGQ